MVFLPGDTWKATPKLSVTLGLRWDVFTPSWEANDETSFLDISGPNPGAGNRLGRLAFAGTRWNAASYGEKAPEDTYHKAFGPRVGFAYSLDPKTVIRAGYGIFFSQAYYPDRMPESLPMDSTKQSALTAPWEEFNLRSCCRMVSRRTSRSRRSSIRRS